MPNSNFNFNGVVYSKLYLTGDCSLMFGTSQTDSSYGTNAQTPINSFKIFVLDQVSNCSYKFYSNNTILLVNLTGYLYGSSSKTFTVKVIIDQGGIIQMNYSLASTYTSDKIVIGYIGNNSLATTDDIFLTLNGVTFNGDSNLDLYSLLNGKTIVYI